MAISPKIFIAGHRGMVGSAIHRHLLDQGHAFDSVVTRTRSELDLGNQAAVQDFFASERPDQVYLAAAKVGGIHANSTYPADFIFENLMIEANVINSAFRSGVKKLLFLGSSCIYPGMASQPMSEDALLTGPLETTNEPYAIAKIAGIKLCESYNRQYGVDYRSVMPTNLYGPGDNYRSKNSHVIPALIARFHNAKSQNAPFAEVWGSGTPKREFLYVDDMASASVHIMQLEQSVYSESTSPMMSHVNVGVGTDISIKHLAEKIADITGYSGSIRFDASFPDGPPRKLLNCEKLNALGWLPQVNLQDGLTRAYQSFLETEV